jgi:hypothetical protein
MDLPIDRQFVLDYPPQNESPASIPVPEWDPELRRETLRLEYAGYVRYGYTADEALAASHSGSLRNADLVS